MGRQIRRVPANWEHPKKGDGQYDPLQEDYLRSLKYFKEEVDDFIEKMTEVIKKGSVTIYDNKFTCKKEVYDYMEDSVKVPNIEDYMPNGEWYQLYEDVSEGTPISPPFETKEEMIKWFETNTDFWGNSWSKEALQNILEAGGLPSGIMTGGKFYSPENQHLI